MNVRVRIVPTGIQFDAVLDRVDGVAQLILSGDLNDAAEPVFKAQLDKIVAAQPQQVVFRMENLVIEAYDTTKLEKSS